MPARQKRHEPATMARMTFQLQRSESFLLSTMTRDGLCLHIIIVDRYYITAKRKFIKIKRWAAFNQSPEIKGLMAKVVKAFYQAREEIFPDKKILNNTR